MQVSVTHQQKNSQLLAICKPNFNQRLLRRCVPESNHGLEEPSGMQSQLSVGSLHVGDRLKLFDACILEKEA